MLSYKEKHLVHKLISLICLFSGKETVKDAEEEKLEKV